MGTVLEKVDIVVKLKKKIAEAKENNDALAAQLQKLLDNIIRDTSAASAL